MRYVSAKVSTQVASHTSPLPFLKGDSVMPSGLRPSPLSSPAGSRVDGRPALSSALDDVIQGGVPWYPAGTETTGQRVVSKLVDGRSAAALNRVLLAHG